MMTDEKGYLRHLEAQLARVNDACDAAERVSQRQEELAQGLAALRELEAQKAAAWVGLEQARERDAEALQEMKRRVEGVERLGDRYVCVCGLSVTLLELCRACLCTVEGGCRPRPTPHALIRIINQHLLSQPRRLGGDGRAPRAAATTAGARPRGCRRGLGGEAGGGRRRLDEMNALRVGGIRC